MKKLIYLFLITLFFSCDSEDTGDCFQKAGTIITEEIDVSPFEKIVVHEGIGLIIETGTEQKVVVETGKNLLNDITAVVIDNELILKNNNTCNFVRDYGITKVHITSPNISIIRNASEQDVVSKGILTFPSLYLRSSGEKSNFLAVGDFDLAIDNNRISIWSNGIANFYLRGKTNSLDVGFTDGDTRFNGKDLIAQNVNVRNVSSNDVLVNPIQSLKGSIRSTGNVISFNQPPVIEVEELSVGKLIFK
jgi:hypothetical protein